MSRQAREGLPAEGGFRHSFFFFSAFYFCAGLTPWVFCRKMMQPTLPAYKKKGNTDNTSYFVVK